MANALEGKKIATYCSSSDLIGETFLEQGYELGKAIAEKNAAVMWGGDSPGIMGEVAQGCSDNNGTAIGVSPYPVNNSVPSGTIIIKTEDMAQKKAVIENNVDAFVIAPGGIGTMDEFFQIVTLKQLRRLDKPIVLYNPDGFYDKMIDWIKNAHDESFIRNTLEDVFHVANSVDEIMQYLEEEFERQETGHEETLGESLSKPSGEVREGSQPKSAIEKAEDKAPRTNDVVQTLDEILDATGITTDSGPIEILDGKRVAVYCAASDLIDRNFLKQGYELGKAIAKNNAEIIWGGGSTGTMGEVAHGCADNGGTTIGIAPNFIEEFESIFRGTVTIKTTDMAQRKSIMENNSDAFVIAPGGAGTMDEFFQIVALKQRGELDKPIIIFNQDGFYDKMIEWIEDAHDKGFIKNNVEDLFRVANSVDEVMLCLKEEFEHQKGEPEETLDGITTEKPKNGEMTLSSPNQTLDEMLAGTNTGDSMPSGTTDSVGIEDVLK